MSYFRTAVLLAGLTALFMGVGYLIGGAGGAVIALAVAAATNLFAYWNSDRMVLSMYGAREVDRATAPELVDLVAGLAARAALPMPRVFLMDEAQPNAFATGRNPQNAAVAVTTGLVQSLSREELAGVIAHELAHIKHHDTLLMTITATIAGAISMLAQFGLFFGGNRDNNNGPGHHRLDRDDDPGAARRHAGADGDQPHARIRRRRSRRAHRRRTAVARVRARQDRQRRSSDSERRLPSTIQRRRTCSSSTRCRDGASTTCSPRIPRPRTASRRCANSAASWERGERSPGPTLLKRHRARGIDHRRRADRGDKSIGAIFVARAQS